MKTIKYILIFNAILVFSGCSEDWLELTNPNVPTVENFWKTEDDFIRAVNATYQTLYYDGAYMRFGQQGLDCRADDMRCDSPWDVMQLPGSFSNPNNSIFQEWFWTVFFGGVHRANFIIKNIDNIDWSKKPTVKDQLLGQTKFLRALYYFHLVTFFKNIPLILEPYESTDDYLVKQADPQLVWEQIYQDLLEASDLLPVSWDGDDIGRATKGAAMAYLGKAYLFNQRWQDAADQFQKVIDLDIYGLMENYGDNFTSSFENNKESMFEVQFDNEVGGSALGWVGAPQADWGKFTRRAITYAAENFGYSDILPTRWILNEFQLEKTIAGEYDPRLLATIIFDYPGATLYGVTFTKAFPNKTKIFPVKYTNWNAPGFTDEFGGKSDINERLMRYADVLLMVAECQNELENRAICAEYIQIIRDRALLPDREAEFAAYTKEEMRNQLSHERALEFALEGHRFDDIRRWSWLNDPEKLDELKAHDTEFNGYVPGREYYSIPQRELDTNPNMVQNPGW